MRKKIIGVVVLIGLLLVGKLIWNMNDISTIRHFAENGQYQTFYTKIKDKVEQHDSAAIEMLMEYFIQAVQTGNLEQVKYYLDQNKNLINMQSKEGARAVDALLVANEQVNLEMLNLLLSYHPELNYTVPYFRNMVPLQMIASKRNLQNGVSMINLLTQHGANPNFCSSEGDASSSALLMSYIADNFEIFQALLKNGASIKLQNKNGNELLGFIVGSYVLEVQKTFPELKNIYENPLTQKVLATIQSNSYRIIHSKNIRYLQTTFENKTINEFDEKGLLKLAQYYAVTNEVDGMTLLKEKGLCYLKNICDDVYQKALLNNNRAIMSIIK